MDDRLDIRQRRAIATSHFYPDSENNSPEIIGNHSSLASCSPFPTFTSRWRARRMNAQLPLRLSMRLVEVVLMALAMYLLPTMIQYVVRCIDDLNEKVGRRAQSPFGSVSGSRILLGVMVFVLWHVIVVWLGYTAFVGSEEEETRAEFSRTNAGIHQRGGGLQWNRTFGRIILPSYLILALLFFAYQLTSRLFWPALIQLNTDGELDSRH
jgi:hypothetical protein